MSVSQFQLASFIATQFNNEGAHKVDLWGGCCIVDDGYELSHALIAGRYNLIALSEAIIEYMEKNK